MKSLYYTILVALCFVACTDLTETAYSSLTSNVYYSNKQAVENAVNAIYEFGYPCAWEDALYNIQELTADQLAWTQKGKHGWDGGEWIALHRHEWTDNTGTINSAFVKPFQGIGLANLAINDISKLDYKALGITDREIEGYLGELYTARAWYYLFLIDMFRSVPIVTDNVTVKGQSSPKDVFNFIEGDLLNAINMLPEKAPIGHFSKTAAAAMLVRLYLNAEVYIGENRREDCKRYAQAIIDNKFGGDYELEDDYRGPFKSGINGYYSKENIFEFPHKYAVNWFAYMYNAFIHFKLRDALGNTLGGNNGIHLTPSRDLEGKLYKDKLGMPFEKFPDGDFRKQQFTLIDANCNYEGFFLIGQQYELDKEKGYGYDLSKPITGTEEWSDKPLCFIDQVGRFSEKPNGRWLEGSNMLTGEENSGIRLLKFPWLPENKGCQDNSTPEIRMAEIYYSLAECYYRDDDKEMAAKLLDKVRKRNYPEDLWNSLSYEKNLSKLTDDEFVDEWGREFLAEKRRRTDLVRWGRFTESWWDKKRDRNDKEYNYFPIPYRALSSNPKLKQTTPGW